MILWKLTTIDHAIMMAPSGMQPTTPSISIQQDPVEYVLAADSHARIRELEAQLERCRAANVYDGNAHKRVTDLETALAELATALELQGLHNRLNAWTKIQKRLSGVLPYIPTSGSGNNP